MISVTFTGFFICSKWMMQSFTELVTLAQDSSNRPLWECTKLSTVAWLISLRPNLLLLGLTAHHKMRAGTRTKKYTSGKKGRPSTAAQWCRQCAVVCNHYDELGIWQNCPKRNLRKKNVLFSFNGHVASTKEHRKCLEASAQKTDFLTLCSKLRLFISDLLENLKGSINYQAAPK